MAWEKRDKTRFYYRSVRVGTKVKKVYCGGGAVGRVAAAADARRRDKHQAERVTWLGAKAQLKEIQALAQKLQKVCALLAEAVLLASGFHRPKYMRWRKWYAARSAVEDGAGGPR